MGYMAHKVSNQLVAIVGKVYMMIFASNGVWCTSGSGVFHHLSVQRVVC